MSDSQLLEAMIGAAIEAGRAVHHIYRTGFEVHTKADSSPVTSADSAAEDIIIRRLAAVAPATPIVAEERAAAGPDSTVAHEFFLVDPLDGTKEFIAHRGEFTVNIALVRAGSAALGVVYAPASACLFAADVGGRYAFRCDQDPQASGSGARIPIHVRAVPTDGITAVASRSHRTPETDAYLARYRIADVVSIGSSLKFCLLAEGKADLYPRLGPTMEWDTAAGNAVLLAAGGKVSAADGAPLVYGKPQFRNSWFVASGALTPLPLGM